MSEYHNDAIPASDPGRFLLSVQKLRRLQPELFGVRSLFYKRKWGPKTLKAQQTVDMLAEHLVCGDTRAAVVVSVTPLIVAAYSDELDCVAMLAFPDWLVTEHQLKRGDRLLTSNTYGRGKKVATDLWEGSAALQNWTNFFPLIADFLSDDRKAIEQRKASISEAEWRRASTQAVARFRLPNCPVRDGRPLRSNKAATTALR